MRSVFLHVVFFLASLLLCRKHVSVHRSSLNDRFVVSIHLVDSLAI